MLRSEMNVKINLHSLNKECPSLRRVSRAKCWKKFKLRAGTNKIV
jgi:hypothetical protein